MAAPKKGSERALPLSALHAEVSRPVGGDRGRPKAAGLAKRSRGHTPDYHARTAPVSLKNGAACPPFPPKPRLRGSESPFADS